MKPIVYLGLWLILCSSTVTFAQTRENIAKEIKQIIFHDTEITFDKTPGYIIGVIVGDSVNIFQYGKVSQDQTSNLVDANTLFEIGGLSKIFTATLVDILVKEGHLAYDASLNSYLLPSQQNKKGAHIDILSLVTHTSGLPRMPLEFGTKEKELNNPYAHYTKKDLTDFYANYFLEKPKKPSYIYSHVNYALLEIAIEQKMKRTFEGLLIEKVCRPLNLNNTVIQLSSQQIEEQLATGHTIGKKATPLWKFKSFKASEGIKTNMDDLLKLVQANIGNRSSPLQNTLLDLQQTQFKTDMGKSTYICKGWHVIRHKKYYDVIAHSGSTSGYRAFMGFVPETKTGVVLLTNSEYGTGSLGYLILKMINHQWKK